jgi:hypothetical protein
MPPYSTLRTFIDALTTGQTNITRCLDLLTNDDTKRATYASQMATSGLLNGQQFPGWLRTELTQAGMKAEEIEHIERWPDAEKETARAQVDQAWTNRRPVHFSWELFDGNDPLAEVRRDPNQDVRVVFRSPRRGVRVTSHINLGEIKVEA